MEASTNRLTVEDRASDLAELAPRRSLGSVRFDRPLPGVAVVTLVGDHDIETRGEILAAFRRVMAHGQVLVDLTPCTSLDSSILRAITDEQERRARGGARVELVAPVYNDAVCSALHGDIASHLMAVHRSRPHGLAAIARR
jgi:hypothetical protein